MKLWQINFTKDGKYFRDRCVSFVWSTSVPTIKTARHYWDTLFPGKYTISDFSTEKVELPEHPKSEDYQFRITERTYK
jgi:hypothetical protein